MFLQYKPNEGIILMSQVGGKPYAYSNFVKFGGVCVLYYNKEMLANTLFVVVSLGLLITIFWPFLDPDHDIPLKTIRDAIGYIILGPYNLISSKT
jgi:hypothetical protein